MKKILYTAFYFCSALLLSSCIGDLDQYPHEDETSSTIYTSADNYKAVLGKIYAAMVTTGQEKGGDPDLSSNSGQDYMGSVVILGGLIFVNFPLCIHLC